MFNNNSKKIITVTGEIKPENLGITLMHEHLFVDQTHSANEEPDETRLREKFNEKVSLSNRGEVVYNAFSYKDNLIISDKETAIEEVKEFRNEGGSTIVDVTNIGLGRDPYGLYQIAKETGLNIIMGSGNFISRSWNEKDKIRSEEQIAKDIIKDFVEGIGILKIKPGIIGEIGISDIKDSIEIKGLKGAAKAQKEINCAITIHTPTNEKVGHEILNILESEGVDVKKVILSHCDIFKMYDFEYLDSIVKRGAYIEFDTFGLFMRTPKTDCNKMLPSDNERMDNLVKHIEVGNIDRILISQDICTKIQLKKFGGYGYVHILKNIVPWFIDLGVTKEQIYKILINNPKTILSF